MEGRTPSRLFASPATASSPPRARDSATTSSLLLGSEVEARAQIHGGGSIQILTVRWSSTTRWSPSPRRARRRASPVGQLEDFAARHPAVPVIDPPHAIDWSSSSFWICSANHGPLVAPATTSGAMPPSLVLGPHHRGSDDPREVGRSIGGGAGANYLDDVAGDARLLLESDFFLRWNPSLSSSHTPCRCRTVLESVLVAYIPTSKSRSYFSSFHKQIILFNKHFFTKPHWSDLILWWMCIRYVF